MIDQPLGQLLNLINLPGIELTHSGLHASAYKAFRQLICLQGALIIKQPTTQHPDFSALEAEIESDQPVLNGAHPQ